MAVTLEKVGDESSPRFRGRKELPVWIVVEDRAPEVGAEVGVEVAQEEGMIVLKIHPGGTARISAFCHYTGTKTHK